jgi:hypothetical protein
MAAVEPGTPTFISREVVEIYNQLVESGRWQAGEILTTPPDFGKTLRELRKILTGKDTLSQFPNKNNYMLSSEEYPLLENLIAPPTSPASSRKTLKRSRKSSPRKQTYKHSKKQ